LSQTEVNPQLDGTVVRGQQILQDIRSNNYIFELLIYEKVIEPFANPQFSTVVLQIPPGKFFGFGVKLSEGVDPTEIQKQFQVLPLELRKSGILDCEGCKIGIQVIYSCVEIPTYDYSFALGPDPLAVSEEGGLELLGLVV
jgi:hypothetical protein